MVDKSNLLTIHRATFHRIDTANCRFLVQHLGLLLAFTYCAIHPARYQDYVFLLLTCFGGRFTLVRLLANLKQVPPDPL